MGGVGVLNQRFGRTCPVQRRHLTQRGCSRMSNRTWPHFGRKSEEGVRALAEPTAMGFKCLQQSRFVQFAEVLDSGPDDAGYRHVLVVLQQKPPPSFA